MFLHIPILEVSCREGCFAEPQSCGAIFLSYLGEIVPKWVAYLFMLQFWEGIGWICYFSIILYNVMYSWMTTPFPSSLLCLSPYCLSMCPISLSSCSLSLSTPDPPGNSAQLAEKLKLSDPLVLERRPGNRDLEPDWLVQLRRQRKELEVSGMVAGSLGVSQT